VDICNRAEVDRVFGDHHLDAVIPLETFESGMRKTVEWYLSNLHWCHRVQDGSYQRERIGVKP
jgi:hypothetical protein